MREIEFFSEKPKKVETKPKPKMNDMFDDLMGGNESDDVDLMDFDAPPNPKSKVSPPLKQEPDELDFNFDVIPEKRVELKRPTILPSKLEKNH